MCWLLNNFHFDQFEKVLCRKRNRKQSNSVTENNRNSVTENNVTENKRTLQKTIKKRERKTYKLSK